MSRRAAADPTVQPKLQPGAAAPTDGSALPLVDPLAVRVAVAAAYRIADDPVLTVSFAPLPILRPLEHLAGTGILGGIPSPAVDGARDGRPSGRAAAAGPEAGSGPVGRGVADLSVEADPERPLMVDGRSVEARLEWLDADHAVLVEAADAGSHQSRLVIGGQRRRDSDGLVLREVVVDGWRIEVELEPERRASLRERARRASDVVGRGGPVEVRAIIPGRIVALSVGPGDPVTAGQQLLVLEAMKMQNELLAPREGTIERIPIAVGENVEVGDLLLVIT